MTNSDPQHQSAPGKTWIITGPTSGIGRVAALELARHGTVILVGRDRGRLDVMKALIEQRGGRALAVLCDLEEMASARKAAQEIIALGLPLAGVLNNAGIRQGVATKNSLGWDASFATNHLGPLLFTETLLPHLPDGAHVIFTASGVEDPERGPAKAAGFRGGRYISAAACARGEWLPGGSTGPGFDSYATSKQAILAAAMALAREIPRLRINALEPGFTPNTGLNRDAHAVLRFVANRLLPLLAPHMKFWSTPERAGKLSARLLTDPALGSGVYFDEKGEPMRPSLLVQDTKFQDRVLSETRALLAGIPGSHFGH